MVDRDGGSGPRTELDLDAAAAAAVDAARPDAPSDGRARPDAPSDGRARPDAPSVGPAAPVDSEHQTLVAGAPAAALGTPPPPRKAPAAAFAPTAALSELTSNTP